MDAEVIDLTDSRSNSPAAAQDVPRPAAARLGGFREEGGDSDDDVIMMDVKPTHANPCNSAPAAHVPKPLTGNADFVPSPKYVEPKPGYFFAQGFMGLGYYKDAAPKSSSLPNAGGAFRAAPAAAAPPAAAPSSSALYLPVPLGAFDLCVWSPSPAHECDGQVRA